MSATGGSTAPMYTSMFVGAASSISTGIAQSRAIKAQGDYEQSVAETNAKLDELRSTESLHVGDAEISRRNQETRLQVGAARASGGASGVDVNSGSTAQVINSIGEMGKVDELTIRNNAARTAWGYKTQALQDRFRGNMARLTSRAQAEQTLITGGLKAVGGAASTYSDYLRYTQRYDGKQASLPNDSEWEGMV